jgi:hypothetical protein
MTTHLPTLRHQYFPHGSHSGLVCEASRCKCLVRRQLYLHSPTWHQESGPQTSSSCTFRMHADTAFSLRDTARAPTSQQTPPAAAATPPAPTCSAWPPTAAPVCMTSAWLRRRFLSSGWQHAERRTVDNVTAIHDSVREQTPPLQWSCWRPHLAALDPARASSWTWIPSSRDSTSPSAPVAAP